MLALAFWPPNNTLPINPGRFHLRLFKIKDNDDKIREMKAAETKLLATADESKARIADLEQQTRGLREQLEGVEAERGKLGLRLDQALQELEKSRQENADRSTKEKVRFVQPGRPPDLAVSLPFRDAIDALGGLRHGGTFRAYYS